MTETGGFPAYEPRDDLPANRPPRQAAAGQLVGRVANSETRVESHGRDFGSETVLSFRLLGPDGQGPRDVQLRGRSLVGSVRDGDWVEVDERERSGRLEVDALRNLTTGAEVKAVGSSSSRGARVVRVLFLIVFVVILLFIVFVALGVFGFIGHTWFFGDGFFGDGGLSGG